MPTSRLLPWASWLGVKAAQHVLMLRYLCFCCTKMNAPFATPYLAVNQPALPPTAGLGRAAHIWLTG